LLLRRLGFTSHDWGVSSTFPALKGEDEEVSVDELLPPAPLGTQEPRVSLDSEDDNKDGEDDVILASSANTKGTMVLTISSMFGCFDRDWTAEGTQTQNKVTVPLLEKSVKVILRSDAVRFTGQIHCKHL